MISTNHKREITLIKKSIHTQFIYNLIFILRFSKLTLTTYFIQC